MKAFYLTLAFCISQSVLAYPDKTYLCQNSDQLPANIYSFRTVQVANGVGLPYVEVTRYYRATPGDVNSEIKVARVRGLASVVQTSSQSEILQVAALRFEFEGDHLLGCRE